LPTNERQRTRDDLDVSTYIRVQLGNRVRALRQEQGWSQVEMAEMLGIDRSYLSEIETGKKDPSLRVFKNHCRWFQAEPESIAKRLLRLLSLLDNPFITTELPTIREPRSTTQTVGRAVVLLQFRMRRVRQPEMYASEDV
jgi:putative transcriptional regulator